MRRMEKQAIQTMAAIEALGKANDHVSGSTKTTKGLEKQERAMRDIERSAKAAGGGLRQLDQDAKRSDRSASTLTQRLIRLGGAFMGLRAIMTGLKFGALGTGITVLVQAVGALAGGLVALMPALVSASGAIAAMPGVLASAAQGFVAFKTAMSGVSDALGAGISLQKQAGQTAIDVSNQHRSAAEAIRNANQGVLTSQRGVRDASEGLTLAYRSEHDAQRALTDARRDAIRELQDMDMAARGAVLSQQRAALSLRQAREQLAQTAIDPNASALDLQSAQLSVSEARLGSRQSRTDRTRAAQDKARAAARGGVRGMPQMIQATRGLADAQRGIRNATEGVSDAMFQQKSAEMALADAQRSNTQALKQGTGAQNSYRLALKQLSPEAKSFVQTLVGMHGRIKDLKAAAGARLFPNLESGFKRLTVLQPMLEKTFKGTGGVIGRGFNDLAGSMTTGSRVKDLGALGHANNQILGKMTHAFSNVTQGMLDMMLAARPLTHWLTSVIEKWTENWAISMKVGRATGTLSDHFDRTRSTLERFGRILSNLWATFKELGQAARPLGERLWDGAEQATSGWADYLKSAEGATKAQGWFDALYDPLHALGQLTKALAKAWANITVDPGFTDTVNHLALATPALEKLMRGLSGLGPSVADVLTQIVRTLANLPFNPLRLFLKALTAMLKIVNGLIEKFPILGDVLAGVLAARFGVGAIGMLAKFGSKLGWLVGMFGKLKDAIIAADIGSALGGGAAAGAAAGGGIRGAIKRVLTKNGESTIVHVGEGAAGSAAAGGAAKGLGRLRGLFGRGGGTAFKITSAEAEAANLMAGGRSAATEAASGASKFGKAAGVASKVASKVAVPLAVADALVNAESIGTSDARLSAKMVALKDNINKAITDGAVNRLRKYAGQIRVIAKEATPAGQAIAIDFVGGIKRAEVAARDSRIYHNVSDQLSQIPRVTKASTDKFAMQLRKMTPDARNAALKALTAQATSLEKNGYLPKGAAQRLVDSIGDKWGQLDRKAHRKMRTFLSGVKGDLEKAIPGISKAAQHVADVIGLPGLGGKDAAVEAIAGSRNKTKALQRRSGLAVDGVFGPATAAAAAKEAGASKKQVLAIVKDTKDGTIKTWKDQAKQTAKIQDNSRKSAVDDAKATKQDTLKKYEDILAGSTTQWGAIKGVIGKNSAGARDEVDRNFTDLRNQAIKALMGVGMPRADAVKILSAKSSGGGGSSSQKRTGSAAATAHHHNLAGGGRLGGHGLHDNIHMGSGNHAAPGELVVNRHTERRINQKLGGKTTLGGEVAGEGTPHYAPMRFARGGRSPVFNGGLLEALGPYTVNPISYDAHHAGSNSHVHIAMRAIPTLVRLGHFLQSKGFSVSEQSQFGGVHPVHAPNSYHYSDQAIDINSAADETHAQVAYIASLLGGAAARMAGGGSAPSAMGQRAIKPLHARASGFTGAAGSMSHLASVHQASALTNLINHRIHATGTSGGAYRGPLDHNFGRGNNQTIAFGDAAKLAERAGLPGKTYAQIAEGESGLRPGAVSPDGGYGLWQMTPRVQSAETVKQWQSIGSYFNPWANAQMAKVLAGSGTGVSNYFGTGFVTDPNAHWGGWKARGFSGTVNRPTIFGAGENGKEHVAITPAGKSSGGGIHIDHITIENHREGDIQRQLQRELGRLADDLDLAGMDS